jgi:hypothetical protein
LPNFPTCELVQDPHLDRHCFNAKYGLVQNGKSDPNPNQHQKNADPQHRLKHVKKILLFLLNFFFVQYVYLFNSLEKLKMIE